MNDKEKPISNEQIDVIQEMAQKLRHGSLTLVFQDGTLIQIDRNEKIRLPTKHC